MLPMYPLIANDDSLLMYLNECKWLRCDTAMNVVETSVDGWKMKKKAKVEGKRII